MDNIAQNSPLGRLDPTEEAALQRRFDSVFQRLQNAVEKSGRPRGSVTLVAVSKWHEAAVLAALARYWRSLKSAGTLAGYPQQRIIFGENYVQEALAKQDELAASPEGQTDSDISWHFCGHLQSNKAKFVTGRFELIQTLDSLSLAQNLQKILDRLGREQRRPLRQGVLVQINIGEEEQKSGLLPAEAPTFIKTLQAFTTIDVQGLMCLPPLSEQPEDSRPYFAALRQLRDALAAETGLALPHLSMGMSHDFEVAVEEGASMVRVGTDIFGERKS